MKKWLVGLMVVVFTMTCSWSIYANPGRFGNPHKGPQGGPPQGGPQAGPQGGPHAGPDVRQNREMQNDSRYIIHRTAQAISEAQRAAERGHRPAGLARAVFAHQRAQQLYKSGNYQDAIFISMRARRLAFDVIRANQVRVRPEFMWDRVESRYDHQGPGDDELDRRMGGDKGRMGRDDDAVRIKIELNF